MLLAGPFLGHVLAVIAGVAGKTAIFEFQDRTGDGVEEVAVVGDDEDGAPRPLDEVLQPLYGAQVEVVGRLVEEDEIRLLHKQAGQGDAALLAAGKGAYWTLPVLGGETQRSDGRGHPGAVLVAAVPLELALQSAVTLHERVRWVLGEARTKLLELLLAGHQGLEGGDDLLLQ